MPEVVRSPQPDAEAPGEADLRRAFRRFARPYLAGGLALLVALGLLAWHHGGGSAPGADPSGDLAPLRAEIARLSDALRIAQQHSAETHLHPAAPAAPREAASPVDAAPEWQLLLTRIDAMTSRIAVIEAQAVQPVANAGEPVSDATAKSLLERMFNIESRQKAEEQKFSQTQKAMLDRLYAIESSRDAAVAERRALDQAVLSRMQNLEGRFYAMEQQKSAADPGLAPTLSAQGQDGSLSCENARMPFPDFEPTVPRLIARLEERHGQRPLVLLGDRRISYAQAGVESARLAQGLLARGIGKGTRVALLFPNGPDWVLCWLAAARIGALVVPVNTFSKPRELAQVLRHADVHTLLTSDALLGNDYQDFLEQAAPSLRGRSREQPLLCPELPYLRQVFVFGGQPRAWASSGADLRDAGEAAGFDRRFLGEVEREVCPADPMLLIYSSGSTAAPKGVVHSQGALIRQSWNLNSYREFGPEDVLWSPMPFFWIGGFGVGLLQTMLEGGLVLCQEAFEPGATLELLERERATHVIGWPQYASALLDHPDFERRDLSSVRAGSLYPLLPDDVRPRDPELRANSLGMTETCGPHTWDRMDVELPEGLRGSFGRALPGVTHKVIDPKSGETLPPGELGEICVRGYNLMQGLYKLEREEVFEPDGFYRTGDSGYFDEEGHLYFRARLSELIKTGGANVTPREVEIVIDAQPEVQCSFVVGVPHPERGQNVAAAVVLNDGLQLDAEVLRARLKAELSAYKVPRHLYFYARAELPFTDSGKMQKSLLAELLAKRVAQG